MIIKCRRIRDSIIEFQPAAFLICVFLTLELLRMNMAAADLNFEMAAIVRDELKKYKEALRDYDK